MAKFACEICGEMIHSVSLHIKESHTTWSKEMYEEKYPGAKLFSEEAMAMIERKKAEKSEAVSPPIFKAVADDVKSVSPPEPAGGSKLISVAKLFGLSSASADVKTTLFAPDEEFAEYIQEIDHKYIFPEELLLNVALGIEQNIPVLLWGHAGVGKSSMYEQFCAYTKRPYVRVQHTANIEESHIVGQILANESGTYFEPGPLSLAMKYGWVYNADEYDFAHASVTAVYQSILEGKSLVIKEAPKEWRIVRPHQNFRFVATGNTNGSGDEYGLYAGTNVGNSANYSRFGITAKVDYMPRDLEVKVLMSQCKIKKADSSALVAFAKAVRDAFNNQQMTATIGTRELIYAATLGLLKTSFKEGMKLAFANRLSSVDYEIVVGLMDRFFSEKNSSADEQSEAEEMGIMF